MRFEFTLPTLDDPEWIKCGWEDQSEPGEDVVLIYSQANRQNALGEMLRADVVIEVPLTYCIATIRQAHESLMKSYLEALGAIAKVKAWLSPTTREIVERLLRGDRPMGADRKVVEEEHARLWMKLGRRTSAARRQAAQAHEAVILLFIGNYEGAIRGATFSEPQRSTRKRPGRGATVVSP